MTVRLTAHRSAHEIGGNCIEVVASGGSRLLLDIGRPLDGEGEAATLLPATLDLGDLPAALLVSHPHQDHYGLLQAAPASWSVHSGAASVRFSVAGCKAKSPDAMGHLRRFGLTSAIPGLPLNADICTNTGLRRNGQNPSSPPFDHLVGAKPPLRIVLHWAKL